MSKLRNFFEQFITRKIGAEIKCCLTFFYIQCFYWIYRWLNGLTEASIIHMFAMLWAAYILEWIQQLIGCDFFEMDSLGKKEAAVIVIGSLLYAAAGHLLGWFDGNIGVATGFGAYMAFSYFCTFAVCKTKRIIDAKNLNSDLKKFQKRNSLTESEE